ncbi:MAG: hypothetical protein Tsb009_21990 [Planctomycetaceae bacterium]
MKQIHVQRHPAPNDPPSVRKRRGFTLTEVLLALTLTVILLGAVYSALNLYRQLSTDGREEAARAQLTRAIHQKMAVDIRSVIFSPPESEEEEDEMNDEESSEEETVVAEVNDPSEAVSSTSKGVVGNSEILTLHISMPPRGLNYSSNLDGSSITSRTSDLISVSYFLAGNSSSELTQRVAENTGKTGLTRLIGDRLALDQADTNGDVETLAESATILAEEINFLKFRYFDGDAWLDEWDSTVYGTLPRAIEVTIGFRPSGKVTETNDGETVHQKRFVISLPVADPTPPTDLGF